MRVTAITIRLCLNLIRSLIGMPWSRSHLHRSPAPPVFQNFIRSFFRDSPDVDTNARIRDTPDLISRFLSSILLVVPINHTLTWQLAHPSPRWRCRTTPGGWPNPRDNLCILVLQDISADNRGGNWANEKWIFELGGYRRLAPNCWY